MASVDIPSGWDVERGTTTPNALQPEVLISLSAPKLCAQAFGGTHYLGGRFLPDVLKAETGIPEYEGSQQFMKL